MAELADGTTMGGLPSAAAGWADGVGATGGMPDAGVETGATTGGGAGGAGAAGGGAGTEAPAAELAMRRANTA